MLESKGLAKAVVGFGITTQLVKSIAFADPGFV
jgi:hypothetical protein